MTIQQLKDRQTARATDFRFRSTEITRIEGLSDAVFAFAVTLLIVSLEVPRTYHELITAMRGFFAFAICFALLIVVWYDQHVFFRRYGLQDPYTIFLNATLLFTALFYVYPLKFIFTQVVGRLMGMPPVASRPDGRVEAALELHQVPNVMIIFGAGYVAVSLMFVLMYWHAWRQRDRLGLNDLERLDTREELGAALISIAVGTASILIAWLASPRWAFRAWVAYPLGLTPLLTIYHGYMGKRRRRLEARYSDAG